MEEILKLLPEFRAKLENCRYDGKNDTQVIDAMIILNRIENIALKYPTKQL